MRRLMRVHPATLAVIGAMVGVGAVTAPAQAAAGDCASAGSTGLTAAVTAHAGEQVSGSIDARGCDVGVYIGPGADDVTVTRATVWGANDHGIFVQDASGVVLVDNTITGNGVNRNRMIPEDKALELAGTVGATVSDNRVVNNDGGGIGLADDGPLDPGAVPGHPGALRPSADNEVVRNSVSGNLNDCAIVITAKNYGTGAIGNTVAHNVLVDVPGVFPPTLGGIVLAGQLVKHNQVVGNTVQGSFMPGIVVHSSRPDTDVSDNVIADNTLSADDWGRINGPNARVAIILATASRPAGELDRTVLANNRISADEDYGIYQIGTTRTVIAADRFNDATVPVYGP